MIVSIHQPAYLPWLGYFHRIAISDVHVVLDHVQFEKNSFTNRNKIRTRNGWSWLTVPVKTAGKFCNLAIGDMEIDNQKPWARKHWESLRQNYSRAPFFAEHSIFFRDLYDRRWTNLTDLMTEISTYLLNALDIRTKLYFSSQMHASGAKEQLVLNLCRELGATVYLSGPLGRNYLNEVSFERHNVKVRYDDYRHPVYSQIYPDFEPHLAAIDLLFNKGPDSRTVLMEQRERVLA